MIDPPPSADMIGAQACMSQNVARTPDSQLLIISSSVCSSRGISLPAVAMALFTRIVGDPSSVTVRSTAARQSDFDGCPP